MHGAERSAGRSERERDSAAFERALARLSATVERAARREGSWLERLRAGLVAFLGFCEDEPWCARVLLCEAPVSDEALALRRQLRVAGVLTVLLDDGCPQALAEISEEPQLTAELVVGGVVAAIRKRILEGEGGALVELAPDMMAFVARPYLGQAAAQAELAGMSAPVEEALPDAAEPPAERLPVRATHRTMLVLRAIQAAPCSSNRQIADVAGLSDEGQTSKLLSRLAQRGVIENVGVGAPGGEPNAWLLTSAGRRVLELTGGIPRAGSPGSPRLPRRRGDGAREGRAA